MVEYTNKEYADMVLVCGEAASNGRVACQIYQERYPHCLTPLQTLFTKVIQWWTIARELGVPLSTVWEILHEQQLHPYHPLRVHAMGLPNFALHANFCMWFLHVVWKSPFFHDRYSLPMNVGSLGSCFKLAKQPCLGWRKLPMSSMPIDSNVSALMCGQVLWTVVWLGLFLFHPA